MQSRRRKVLKMSEEAKPEVKPVAKKKPVKKPVKKAKPKVEARTKKQKTAVPTGKIAVVRVRGISGVRHDMRKTLRMLRLFRRNNCVVLENTPSNLGMIMKVKDFVTFGEIDDKTYQELVDKRGSDFKGREESSKGVIKYKNNFVKVGSRKIKPYFRLSPPRGGFERKGTKVSFKNGGVLGYREAKMADLIKKMI